jgi:hypothetical protein
LPIDHPGNSESADQDDRETHEMHHRTDSKLGGESRNAPDLWCGEGNDIPIDWRISLEWSGSMVGRI